MNKRGFTLIELLIVIVIIGILAGMASLRIAAIRDKGTRASMVSDLKNLITAEESYFAANNDYTAKTASIESVGKKSSNGTIAYLVSPGNTLKLKRKGTGGWNATMTNKSLVTKPKTCGIFVGPSSYSPNKNVDVAGVPACY